MRGLERRLFADFSGDGQPRPTDRPGRRQSRIACAASTMQP